MNECSSCSFLFVDEYDIAKGERRLKYGKNQSLTLPKLFSVLPGILSSIVMLLVGAVGITALINGEKIADSMVGYPICAVVMLSAWLAAYITIRKNPGNRLLAATMSMCGMFVVLLIGNVLLAGGKMNGLIQTFLLVAAGSACAVFINTDNKKGKKYRYKK